MLTEYWMIVIGFFALLLCGFNIAYALFSNGQRRSIVLTRGLICGYVGVLYLAYAFNNDLFHDSFRYWMRAVVVIILALFAGDTWILWKKSTDKPPVY